LCIAADQFNCSHEYEFIMRLRHGLHDNCADSLTRSAPRSENSCMLPGILEHSEGTITPLKCTISPK
jgi:hypothetical protein